MLSLFLIVIRYSEILFLMATNSQKFAKIQVLANIFEPTVVSFLSIDNLKTMY